MHRFVTSIAIVIVLVQVFASFSAYELATFDSLDSFSASEVMPIFARARLVRWLQLGALVTGAVALVAYLRVRRRGSRERLVARSIIYTGLAFTVAAVFGNPWLQLVAEIVALSVPVTAIAAAWYATACGSIVSIPAAVTRARPR